MYYVYVLKSIDHYRFYVGMTENLERRLNEHNIGKTKSTKAWRPWKVFFSEVYDTRELARQREKYLKSGYGKQWIKEKWSRSSAG
jgi:putative endonuclease